MTPASLDIRPLAGSLGAEILGIDIGRPLPDATVAAIRRALVDHGVIFFRDQALSVEAQKAFARRFGPIFIHPNLTPGTSDPEVVVLRREPGDRRIVGEEWHADTTMTPAPPLGAVLYGVEIPPYGGDTLFANQCLAYESLSDGMKRLIAGLRAVHSDRKYPHARGGHDWKEATATHPVVRVHAESGRRSLFVNHSFTVRFEGMTEDESRPLLEFLMNHGHRPEFTCRFRWAPGSVAFWDNRSVKHLAIDDAGQYLRVMRRVQIAGEVPIAAPARDELPARLAEPVPA